MQNPMNLIQLANQLKNNANPMQVLNTMFGNNPMYQQALQMIQGKSKEQIKETVLNLCKTNGIDINQIKKPELTGNVAAFLPNGKNLIEVLDFLNKNNHDIFESISLSLIGEIEAITGLEIDNSTFMPSLKFKEEIKLINSDAVPTVLIYEVKFQWNSNK